MSGGWLDSHEAALVGAILQYPDAMAEIAGDVSPDDFEHGPLRRIYAASLDLWRKGDHYTAVDVGAVLNQGDKEIAAECFSCPPLTSQVKSYAAAVRRDARRRRLRGVGSTIMQRMDDIELSPEQVAEEAAAALHTITGADQNDMVTIADGVRGFLPDLERRASGDVRSGIPFPWPTLNRLTGGMEDAWYVIIGGRPSVGKTIVGINICEHAAREGYRALYCNLESSKEALIRRMVSSVSGVSAARMRMGQVDSGEWPTIAQACASLEAMGDNITVWDAPSATPNQLRAECMRIDNTSGLDLVIIDYVQLMRSGLRMESRHLEIEHISQELKSIAKSMSVPVVALAQLGRGVMQGDDGLMRRPHMSDLKESGSLEQDADLILFPHRERIDDEQAKMIIGKQKDGPTADIDMRLEKRAVKFVEAAGSFI
ncbi:MAG: AAA family ATPase [Armatimonadia bacterium]|nr:AAA family ATPase [Armatimonadia bacterium]